MGGNAGASAGGLSGLLGGGGQSFDPTTGSPIGSPPFSDWGGAYSGNPANPAVTEQTPQQAAQNIQASSYDPTTGQPTTTSPTGSQSGPSTPSWVQNLSNIFLGGQGSPAAQAGLTGGRGGATPAPQTPVTAIGAPAQAPGETAAAAPGLLPTLTRPETSATVLPQSAPVSGKTQAVPEVAPAVPAPETAPAAAAPDTTNYPDVSGTLRESGAGPGGAGAYNNPAFSTPQGGGLPPVLQDLFSLNFGRFIADLLGQQGMPASQNQAAAPPPSTDTGAAEGDTATEGKTGDTATADAAKKAQTPAQKAAGAVSAVGEAIKPKKSPVDATATPGAAPPAQAGTAGTATAAPTTPAGAPPSAPATGQPAATAAAPTTTAGPGGTNLMGTGFFNPQTGAMYQGKPPPPQPAAAQAPGTPAVGLTPAAATPASGGTATPTGRPLSGTPQAALTPGTPDEAQHAAGASIMGRPSASGIPASILAGARDAARQGGPRAVDDWMRRNGHPRSGNWCAEFASAVMSEAHVGLPPGNANVASNWRNWGRSSDTPVPGGVIVRKGPRTGNIGSHVAIVERVDKNGDIHTIGGNQGDIRRVVPRSDWARWDFRAPPPDDEVAGSPILPPANSPPRFDPRLGAAGVVRG